MEYQLSKNCEYKIFDLIIDQNQKYLFQNNDIFVKLFEELELYVKSVFYRNKK